jgi:signal transduction histidine kinase/CheY-like chemotaxis protein
MDFFALVLRARAKPWIGPATAVIGPAAGMAVRGLLGGTLAGFPFITFFPGILLAAMFGGPVSGFAAMLISALLAVYFLIPPIYSLILPWPNGFLAMGIFLLVGVPMVLLVDGAAQAGERLQTLNAELETRVAARTRELTLLTARLREEIRIKELAETQMRQMQKMEAVGQLTGGIAHDFNNMLAIVMGNLELATRTRKSGVTDIGRLLDNAMEGASRAAKLTHQLLAFARQQPLEPVVADINGIVGTMAEILRRSLGETINLKCRLAGDLWRTRVDPGQLENAILNLAVNARDAMPGGGSLTIETHNAWLDDAYAAEADIAAGPYVLIVITDTGTGMKPEIIAQAFEPFFTTKPAGRGTGLGLSQVYGFIRQSSGHVKIHSAPEIGTSVKIYLPRVAAALEAEAPPPADAPPRGAPDEILLLVEDDDAVRQVHLNMLRGLNYTVYQAASGAAALEILHSQPGVTLLFTDVVMPGMSGRQLAEQARAAKPALKVLYTTGYTTDAIVHHGEVDPEIDLLRKPFTYDALAKKLRAVIERR